MDPETPVDPKHAAFVNRASEAIRETERLGSHACMDIAGLTGYSGNQLIGALQRFCGLHRSDPSACYLEIGVYQGLTLLSVAKSVPEMACFGIDNFAFFDPDKENLAIIESRRSALDADNAILINKDYEDALEALDGHLEGRKIAVLFVDGPHDYRSQLMCLQLALPYLHQQAVIVVDDSNYRHVRQANRDFLATHREYALLFEAYTRCHPANMPPAEQETARAGWWNGVNVLVRDPLHALGRNFPPTERSRTLFENEHVLHASPVASFFPKGDRLLFALDRFSLYDLAKQLVATKLRMRKSSAVRRQLYPAMNTYSDHLPSSRHHPPSTNS
jgi:predicted O-methyltransferase YrrM